MPAFSFLEPNARLVAGNCVPRASRRFPRRSGARVSHFDVGELGKRSGIEASRSASGASRRRYSDTIGSERAGKPPQMPFPGGCGC